MFKKKNFVQINIFMVPPIIDHYRKDFVWDFTPYQWYFSYLTLSQTSPGFYMSAVQVF